MKKLLAILLALTIVGGAFAQIQLTAKTSGSVYLVNARGDGNMVSSLSPDGGGYDVLTFTAEGKDKNYGLSFYYNNFLASTAAPDYWSVWYDLGIAKFTMGTLNYWDQSAFEAFHNGWIENYDPTGFSGKGLKVESKDLGGLKLVGFLPLTAAAAPVTTLGTYVETMTDVKAASMGASYAIGEVATIKALVNLGVETDTTNVDVGIAFTGVENLDTYAWANYNQDKTYGFGLGGQYKTSLFRVYGEFEGYNDGTNLAFDAIGGVRYYVTPALFVQARGYFYNEWTTFDADAQAATKLITPYGDSRIKALAYVNYAFGNGFSVEGMIGYDTLPIVNARIQDASLVSYVKLVYGVSF